MPELGLLQWVIGGMAAVGAAVVAFLVGRDAKIEERMDTKISEVHVRIDEATNKDIANELETLRLRLHISENYSTKEENRRTNQKIGEVELQFIHSLERIHEKIEAVPKNILALLGVAKQ